MSRLNDLYKAQIKNTMREKFGYKNDMEIPKLDKIVINIGVGEATENSKAVDAAASDLAKPINPWLHGRSVKECRSAAKLPFVVTECTNSSIV